MTENSSLETLTDTVETIVSGIPAPIKRNFLKAFAQLSTSALDIPISWLESKSAEIRATSEARIKIIKKEGESFAEKIEAPQEYVKRASEKYASKIIKEQINLDNIAVIAAKELGCSKFETESTSEKEIGDDWLNEFESNARLMSSDEMKLIFGKILSGEISNPGSFSKRTIRIMAQLDNLAAQVFLNLCTNAIIMKINNEHILDSRVISFDGNAGSNSLSKFGLSFDNLNILQEYGLIISDYNSYMNYSLCVVNENNTVVATLEFNGKNYALMPSDRDRYDKTLQFHGVALTKSGKELQKIMTISENPQYFKEFETFLEARMVKLVDVKTGK